MLWLVNAVATLAVTVEPFNPKLTPLLLANSTAPTFALDVPALTLMLPAVLATVADAVTVEPFNPKLTLFEFENTTEPSAALDVPADRDKDPPPPPSALDAV